MVSSCFPSAVLQRTSISWKKPLHASGAPMFAPRGYLLTAWLWRSRELVFLVPWNCNNWCHPEGSSYPFGTPICAAAAREHLYHPALAASGLCAHGSHKIITNEKRVLQQLPPPLPPPPLPPQAQEKATDPEAWSFYGGGLLLITMRGV